MVKISVIIVSWNALEHLKTFLPSVMHTEYEPFEVILADNASTDGSASWVEEHYPGVAIERLDKNYGYCGGNNRAAAQADGEILLFLNNDVKVDPGWLGPIAKQFEDDETVGAVQPKMLDYSHPNRFEYAGAAGGFIDRYGYPFCRGRIFNAIEEDFGQYDQPSPIFWASGAALAIRSSLFERYGGFDETFEFHMEEIDLCWRLWNQGYQVRYCPDSVVYHLGGGSLPMDSPRKVYYNYRNNLVMLLKNLSANTVVPRFVIRYKLDVLSAFRSLMLGELRTFEAIVKAHASFWKRFGKVLEQRKQCLAERTVTTDPDLMLDLSLVWHYFIRGKKTFQKLISQLPPDEPLQ